MCLLLIIAFSLTVTSIYITNAELNTAHDPVSIISRKTFIVFPDT